MKRAALFALTLLVLPSLALADARKDIEAVYAAVTRSWHRGDAAGTEKLVRASSTPDFAYIALNGQKQTLDQVVAMIKMQIGMTKKIEKTTTKVTKFTLKGNTAVAVVANEFVGQVMMDPNAKKPSKLVAKSVSTDTWVKTPKGWRMKTMKTDKETITVDGKPMSM